MLGGVPFVRLVAVFKLIKAVALLASLALAFNLIHHDPIQTVVRYALTLHVDPGNRYLRALLAKILQMPLRQFELFAAGVLIYALVFATEGIGLLLDRGWAEWLTIVETAGFIPLEVYEIAQKPSGLRILVLLLNLAVVIVLGSRARQRKRAALLSHPMRRGA